NGSPRKPRVVRREARPMHAFGYLGRKYLLTPRPLENLEILIGELDRGGSTGDEPYTHGDSEELFFVVSGQVQLQLGDEVHQLEQGDGRESRSPPPHRTVNVGDSRGEVMWVISPPSY